MEDSGRKGKVQADRDAMKLQFRDRHRRDTHLVMELEW